MSRMINFRLFLLTVNKSGFASRNLAFLCEEKLLILRNIQCINAVNCSTTRELHRSSGAPVFPTHTVFPQRYYSSAEWEDDPRKKKSDSKKPGSSDEDTALARVSLKYSFKFFFLYMTKHRELLKICLNSPSFFSGLKRAFCFVTDCLSKKDIEDLQDVVTDELFAKIEVDPSSIYSKSCDTTFAVKSSDLMFVTLNGLRTRKNPNNGNRILEVDTRYTFVKDFATRRSNFKEMMRNYTLFRFANVKFVREVDSNGEPGRWLINSLYFYTSNDWPGK